MNAAEVWKDIEGYPDYQVSSLGRVMRKAGFDSLGRAVPERIRKLVLAANGYLHVMLYRSGQKKHFCRVSRLVAIAFLGPADGRTVNHKDLDKLNNAFGNLEYLSHQANIDHAVVRGRFMTESRRRAGLAKLNPAKAREIRALAGLATQRAIAKRFGITQRAVWQVLHRITWRAA